MNFPKKEINKWIEALRSGDFKQTKGMLQDADGFCCLGVACKLFSPHYPLEGRFLKGAVPHEAFGAPKWLDKLIADFGYKMSLRLTYLNDCADFTFDEIADLLQAVYILEVLK